MKKVVALIALAIFVTMPAQAAEKNDKKKKPEVTVEETHPDRDHKVEADDVHVDRQKTKYTTGGDKNYNLRFGPIGLLFGVINADFDIKMGPTFTIGPSVSYLSWTLAEVNVTAYSFGVRANFYPNIEALSEDGWYIGPSVNYIGAKATKNSLSASVNGINTSIVGGYQWLWDSFNINLGLGGGYTSIPTKVTVKDSSGGTSEEVSVRASQTSVALEFTMGFAF